jgi:hypothetical protein
MVLTTATLDARQARGIIIRSGAPPRGRLPFWAYLWSEELEQGACAGMRGGRILDTVPSPDGSPPACRASP